MLIFFLSGLIFLFTFKAIRTFYFHELEKHLEKLAFAIEDSFRLYLYKKNNVAIDRLAKYLGKKVKVRITVIAPNGTVWGDSEKTPEKMENHANRPEVKQALHGKKGKSIRFSATLQKKMFYLAIPVYWKRQLVGIVRVSLFAEEINHLLGQLKLQLLELILLSSLFASLLALFLSRNFARPIWTLARAASAIARGQFQTRVHLNTKDELGQLARHFNEMANQIELLFQELSLERGELKAIMEGLQAALVVLDMDGRILLANQAFKEMVSSAQIEGRFYWEILREPALNSFLKVLREKPRYMLQEMAIKNKIFLCSATFISKRRELALIFHDLTPLKEIERVKRDLVANVSHELKTPLTAIKGFIETLLEEETDARKKRYLEITRRHTERLCNIVQDLLTLSALETKSSQLRMETVNLSRLLVEIKDFFSSRLRKKGLFFEISITPQAEIIKADVFKLEQLFINLVDNAIKYTEKGGISITVEELTVDKIKIVLADTGIGISAEHLPRIFERFYVVGKSRSRKTGGTGLGLAIAKHIVQLHRGEIKVESQLGKGTKFIIILPKNTCKDG